MTHKGAIMFNLLVHELFSKYIAILGWGIGLALFGAMYVGIYPQMADYLPALGNIPLYQSMGFSMGSFEEYLASAVVQFTPIMAVIYVVISSTATLAGEEESGTLELIITMPLARWQIFCAKALALSVAILIILAIAALGSAITLMIIENMIETNITAFQLFSVILSSWPLLMAFLMIGLFLGAFMPDRLFASMTLTIIVLISYFGKILAFSLPSLANIKFLFLFSHFDTSPTIFSQGIKPEGSLILLGVAAVFFVLSLLSFERRDITVGLWLWQRTKRSS